MCSQKLNNNKKLYSIRKAITALLIISILFGMLQTSAFAAADESLRIQVGDTASTWEEAITEANIKGSAIIGPLAKLLFFRSCRCRRLS